MNTHVNIFVWNDHFNTGLPAVDAQHRQLLAMLNELASRLVFAPDGPGLQHILQELTEYATHHFRDEEAIWAQYLPQDPLEVAHRASHSQFFDQIAQLKQELQSRPLAELAETLLGFLARWLVSHILGADRHLAHLVTGLQQGLDMAAAKELAAQQVATSAQSLIDIILSVYGALATHTPRLMREVHEHELASAALQASEARMRGLFDKAPLAYQSLDMGGHILEVNAVWQAQMGYSRDEVMGKFIGDFIADTSQETLACEFPRFQSTGRTDGPVFEMVRKDGSRFLWQVNGRIARDELGNALHTHCLLTDITERQQMEAALAHERHTLKTLIQTIPDLVWLKDPNGVYLACNPRFQQLYGASESDIVGKTDADFVAPELAEFFRTHDQLAVSNGGPTVNDEWLTFASDGHSEWVETTKTPMFDAQGQLIGVLGIGRDMTERQRSAQELQRREQYLRAVLDNFPFIIWLKDSDNRYLAVNQAFAHASGASQPEELVGKSDLDIWPTALANAYRLDDDEVRQTGIPKTTEEPIDGPGQKGWVETYKSPVRIDQQVIGTVGYARDITGRKTAEEKLLLAASVFTHALEGIMITTADGVVLDVNEAFSRITGYSRAEVTGQHTRMLSSGRQGKEFYAQMWQSLTTQGRWSGEIWNRRKSGEVYAEMLTISAVRNTAGVVMRYVALFSDISKQKEHEHRLEHIAHYDALTGLPNRVLLADRLRQSMAQTVRRNQQLGLVFLDLDGFKAINDEHGHDMGDQLLLAVATRMQQALRDGDTLARLGGDEFVAVLGDLADAEAAAPVLERLRVAAAQPFLIEGRSLQVSASLGVAFYPQRTDMDAEQLLRQADQAMYQAKVAGKNRCHVFDDEQDRSIRGHHESLEAIRQGLKTQAFELYYQPKVNMRTGALVGAEALIRWHHPERGLLLPGEFLPLLHNSELSIELGEWVLDAAMAQMALWKAQGLQVPVSVNIDAQHLQRPNFVPRLKALLASHPQVGPGDLELEILETSALDDIARVSQLMNDCRSIGVGFALDDFGTGYSSLTYLRRLPAALLKIDQSFVRDLLDDPKDMAILEGVLGLARAFRMQAIAEGVETVAHGEFLLRLGCDWGQGYAIARPMPAHALADFVANWRPEPSWKDLRMTQREDLPLLTAVVGMRSWVTLLEAHLADRSSVPPELDANTCEFGRWLRHQGRERHGSHAGYAQVATLHQTIYRQAQAMVELHAQGQADAAQALLPDLYATRQKLTAQMLSLLNSGT
jgi:diguanylate cyclase (GGDEF)-like protein/hemerythrin-like metal-binding protein/PAS domain S-box-containing protein